MPVHLWSPGPRPSPCPCTQLLFSPTPPASSASGLYSQTVRSTAPMLFPGMASYSMCYHKTWSSLSWSSLSSQCTSPEHPASCIKPGPDLPPISLPNPSVQVVTEQRALGSLHHTSNSHWLSILHMTIINLTHTHTHSTHNVYVSVLFSQIITSTFRF